MGKFTNPVLIAAGTALIVVGVAAQTGTVNFAGRGGVQQGAKAVVSPETSPSPPASPPLAASTPPRAPVAPQPGAGQGDGGDGGGDGGD